MRFFFLIVYLLVSNLYLYSQTYEFAKSFGSLNSDFGNSIAIDKYKNIYTVGTFMGTIDMDPSSSVFNLTNNGWLDVFVQKLDSNGNFVWAKSIGGQYYERAYSISLDTSGYLYISGVFGSGVVDFDPGVGVYNVTASGQKDIYILKLDTSGSFIWVKTIPTSGSENYITNDNNGGVYITGGFSSSVDFDPDTGVTYVINNTISKIFTLKFDSSGSFKWVKSDGSNGWNKGFEIAVDNSGNVYNTGFYTGGPDFDPDTGQCLLPVYNSIEKTFVQKLDSGGTLMWAKGIGGSGICNGNSIAVDVNKNTFITGFFTDTIDADPNSGVFNLYSNGDKDVFILKLDSSGNFVWAKSFGGTSIDEGFSLSIDIDGYIYTTGRFYSTVDFDPGIGTTNLSTTGWGSNMFIQKLDNNGNLIWVKKIGSNSPSEGYSLLVNQFKELFLTGFFQDIVDFNPDSAVNNLTSNGGQDVFVLKLSQDICSELSIVVDSTSNLTCNDSLGYMFTHGIGGTPPYTYSWDTNPVIYDSNAIFNSSGLYTITLTDVNNCSTSKTKIINEYTIFNSFDLNAFLVSTNFRVGFHSTLWIEALNSGCIDTSGQVILVIDNLVSFDSSSINPDYINGDTVAWNFNNLFYNSTSFQPQVFLTTSTFASIGDTVCFDLIITPINGDANTLNNTKQYCLPVLNGYDPNDKKVYPEGECEEKYILPSELLTYTIRFQNTGNAEAVNIFIIDTISQFLDINSINIISSSHQMQTEVLSGNVLKFVFDNIYLPDSTNNEPESHGFIIFEINPLQNLPNNTVINNECEIYFDYNPPVITNYTSNTIIDIIPCIITSNKINADIENEIVIYPNPSSSSISIINNDNSLISEIKFLSITGEVIKIVNNNKSNIDISNLPKGIYFLNIKTTNNEMKYKKLIIQ